MTNPFIELWEAVQPFLAHAGEVLNNNPANPGEVLNNNPANPAEGAAPLEPAVAPEQGAAQEAPAPAEVHQKEELLRSIHAQIKELVRQRCERAPWKRGLSTRFPEQDRVYAQGAKNIMGDLEISEDMDTDTLRSWNEAVQNPARLQSLIKEHFPD